MVQRGHNITRANNLVGSIVLSASWKPTANIKNTEEIIKQKNRSLVV
jgi:hypothetical protein